MTNDAATNDTPKTLDDWTASASKDLKGADPASLTWVTPRASP